jgi:hypothetical protein
VRSAYLALRAAIRTRPAPNPASIRSPTSSNRVSDVSDLLPFSLPRGRSWRLMQLRGRGVSRRLLARSMHE